MFWTLKNNIWELVDIPENFIKQKISNNKMLISGRNNNIRELNNAGKKLDIALTDGDESECLGIIHIIKKQLDHSKLYIFTKGQIVFGTLPWNSYKGIYLYGDAPGVGIKTYTRFVKTNNLAKGDIVIINCEYYQHIGCFIKINSDNDEVIVDYNHPYIEKYINHEDTPTVGSDVNVVIDGVIKKYKLSEIKNNLAILECNNDIITMNINNNAFNFLH